MKESNNLHRSNLWGCSGSRLILKALLAWELLKMGGGLVNRVITQGSDTGIASMKALNLITLYMYCIG